MKCRGVMDDKQWLDAGGPANSRCRQEATVFFRVTYPFPSSIICLCERCAARRNIDKDEDIVMLSDEEIAVMEIHES